MTITYIGEIVRSNTAQFSAILPKELAEQPQLPVQLGTLVKVEMTHLAVFGIVSFIEHAPIETNRKVLPHGKTKLELRREMPQVFELVHTEFSALIVGFQANGKILQALPPTPPDLHDFVYPTSRNEVEVFLKKPPTFLRLILQNKETVPDEVIVAFFRNHHAEMERQDFIALGKELSYLLGDDHRRLESILTRIHD